jgi:hypothetical protein
MAKRLSGWRGFVVIGVAVTVLVVVVLMFFKRDIRLWFLLRDFDERPQEVAGELRRLGLPYKDALGRALLAGGRDIGPQFELTMTIAQEPFYSVQAVREALDSKDPIVRRAAALAALSLEPAGPSRRLPPGVLEVVKEWAEDPSAPYLSHALKSIQTYEAPEARAILTRLLRAKSEGTEAGVVARSIENREAAALVALRYAKDPDVRAALLEVAGRKTEGPLVRMRAWQSLMGGSDALEEDMLAAGAREGDNLIRQVIAEHLRHTSREVAVPLIRILIEDPLEVVRRGALDSAIRHRLPMVMDDAWYLGEDHWEAIRGDVAEAVDIYRREDMIPFMIWTLSSGDHIQVEKALVGLHRMTGKHHGFDDDQWGIYTRAPDRRNEILKEFSDDVERRDTALAKWGEEYGVHTDQDRRRPLIRMLGHKDRENVRRAMRELHRITGRKEGFPPETLDPKADIQKEADAIHRFVEMGGAEKVIADWNVWLTEQEAKGE